MVRLSRRGIFHCGAPTDHSRPVSRFQGRPVGGSADCGHTPPHAPAAHQPDLPVKCHDVVSPRPPRSRKKGNSGRLLRRPHRQQGGASVVRFRIAVLIISRQSAEMLTAGPDYPKRPPFPHGLGSATPA